MRVIIFILFYFSCSLAISQTPNDCVNAITICGNGVFSSNAQGIGNFQEVSGCSGMEHNSIWLKINVVQSGNLGFHIRPNDPDLAVDYDFWVYAANRPCNNLGAPIRCATTNPIQAGLTSNHTGMYGATTATQVGPGADGDGYVRWLTVTAGQTYYIAIDRPEGDGGFELEWIGSATDGEGAFAPPPDANAIPDYKTCSSNPDVGVFDFNSIRSSINPDLINNTITFYNNIADAFDNVNALPNIIANTTNPQEIIAKVTNTATGCFNTTSFNLVVFPVPDAEIIISDTEICAGEDITITINGTPESTVDYQINGGAIQSVLLDDTGIYMFTDSPSIDTIYTLIEAKIEGENNTTVCSQPIDESVSVTVNEIVAPLVTTNGPLCAGDDAEIIFSGDAGAQITFLLNGVADVVTLDASGTYTVIIANASEDIEVELLSIALATAPFCTLDLTGTNITVTVNPLPIYENLAPVELCDFNNPGDEQEMFVLDYVEIVGGQAGHSYTFYESYENAENAVDVLPVDPSLPWQPVVYYNTSNPQTLYIRSENVTTGCFMIMPLELRVLPIPVAIQPDDLIECDDLDNDGFAIFDLTAVETQLLGTQNPDDFTVTYYLSQAAAENSGTAINTPDSHENTVAGGETIYVRVENNGDSNCYAVTSFVITVNPAPDASFEMTATCNGVTATILGDTGGTFSFSQAPTDAAVINPTTGEITNATQGTTYHVAYTVDGVGCSTTHIIPVTINTLPNIVTPSNLQQCGVVSNGAWFDLDSKINEITNNDSTLSVSFYLTQLLAETGNAIDALVSPYFATSASQTIYVRVEGNPGCVVYTELVLELFDTVTVTNLPTISECGDDNNMANFNLTQIESLLGTNPNWEITYHTTQSGAQNGTGIITNATNYPSATATVYVRIINTLDVNGICNVVLSLPLQVNPLPTQAISEIVICESGSTGFTSFDLQAEIPSILGTQNASDFTVNFFLDSAATNQIITNPFVNTVANLQPIYVQITNINTNCQTVNLLNLQVLSGVELINPEPIEVCDDVSNDGIATFDLTAVENELLNNQNPNLFVISYHTSYNDAQNNTAAIATPANYQNTNSPFAQTIYIRVERTNSSDCSSIAQVQLIVNVLPEPEIFTSNGNNTICVDYETNQVENPLLLQSSLQGANYSYQWYLNGTELVGQTFGTYEVNTPSPGLYSVLVVDNLSNANCNIGISADFEVIQSGLASFISVTTSEPFTGVQTITVTVAGYGEYWFQLNNGPILDNNGVFTHVPSGIHTVYVYDKKTDNPSCGFIVIDNIRIIDYPKFFTPNNDGNHDSWNIWGLQNQSSAKILIYDRYGKILASIKPQGPGWDGTYQGSRMPSNDYWFVLTYMDNEGLEREFKAHFALKR